jgi:hypothetical protein
MVKDRSLSVWVGVDASTKRDSTALVAVTFDRAAKCVRLVAHKVFTPTPGDPIDFESTIEKTLREWHAHFRLRQVLFGAAAGAGAHPGRGISADVAEPDRCDQQFV